MEKVFVVSIVSEKVQYPDSVFRKEDAAKSRCDLLCQLMIGTNIIAIISQVEIK